MHFILSTLSTVGVTRNSKFLRYLPAVICCNLELYTKTFPFESCFCPFLSPPFFVGKASSHISVTLAVLEMAM